MSVTRRSRMAALVIAVLASFIVPAQLPAQAALQTQSDPVSRFYFGTLDGRIKWVPYSIGLHTPTQVVYEAPGSLFGVTGLTIDGPNNRLYWVGQDTTNAGYVRRANLTEGANPTLMWQEPRTALNANYLTGLALNNIDNKLYWSGVTNATAITYTAIDLTAPLVTWGMAEGDAILTYDQVSNSVLASDNRPVSTVKALDTGISGIGSTIAANETKVSSIVRSLDDQTIYWASCLELISTAAQQDCSGTIRAKTGNNAPIDLATGITGLTSLAMAQNGCLAYATAKGVIGTVANNLNCPNAVIYDGAEIITSLYVMSSPIPTAATTVYSDGNIGSSMFCDAHWRGDIPAAHLASAGTVHTYSWNRNGIEIPGASNANYIPQDPGIYTCDAAGSNVAGTTVATRGLGAEVTASTVIRGNLKNSLGQPILNVTVVAVNSLEDNPSWSSSSASDSNGNFSVTVPTGGTYYLNFFPDNANQVQDYVRDLSLHPVTAVTGQTSPVQEFQLKAIVNYSGKFVDSSGKALQWIVISAWPEPNRNGESTGADASGNFSVATEEGTTVRFLINADENFGSFWYGGADYESATAYTPTLGGNSNLGTITLLRVPKVTGKVLLSPKNLVVPGTVTLVSQTPSRQMYTAAVGADGSFSITAPVGSYKACFTATARKYGSVCNGSRGSDIDAAAFTLVGDQVKTLNFSVPGVIPGQTFTAAKTSRTSTVLRWKSTPTATKYQVRARFGSSLTKLSAWKNVYLSNLFVYADSSSALKAKPKYACYSMRAIGNANFGAWSAQKCVKLG